MTDRFGLGLARHFMACSGNGLPRIACCAAILLLSACVSPRTDPDAFAVAPTIVQSPVRVHKEYLLAIGDKVEVSVWGVPEASRTVTIAPDGSISLPLVGQVTAAGMTARELGSKLKTLYSARLVAPEVTVIPAQVRQPVVYVLGDVNKPTAVPLREAATVAQALTLAGGVRRSGAEADVSIIRLAPNGHLQAIPVDVTAPGQPGPYLALSATRLQADDLVFVPENGRSQVSRFMDDILVRPLQVLLDFKLVQTLTN